MIRRLLCLLLALTLAATSVSAAVMRSEMQGAAQIEICSDSQDGSGLRVITLDATGRPISHHACADCTAALAALLPNPAYIAAPQPPCRAAFAAIATDLRARAVPTQTARDPPAFA